MRHQHQMNVPPGLLAKLATVGLQATYAIARAEHRDGGAVTEADCASAEAVIAEYHADPGTPGEALSPRELLRLLGNLGQILDGDDRPAEAKLLAVADALRARGLPVVFDGLLREPPREPHLPSSPPPADLEPAPAAPAAAQPAEAAPENPLVEAVRRDLDEEVMGGGPPAPAADGEEVVVEVDEEAEEDAPAEDAADPGDPGESPASSAPAEPPAPADPTPASAAAAPPAPGQQRPQQGQGGQRGGQRGGGGGNQRRQR